MTRPAVAPATPTTDYEGRVIHRAVLEVEAKRRWRSIIVWAVSLSLCAGFGWLAILAALSGSDAPFARLRTNALAAFLASAVCLIALARPRPGWPSVRQIRLAGGIVYLSALGGLILLGVWLALVALVIEIAGAHGPIAPAAMASTTWAWLVSGGLLLALGTALTLFLLRFTPGVPRR